MPYKLELLPDVPVLVYTIVGELLPDEVLPHHQAMLEIIEQAPEPLYVIGDLSQAPITTFDAIDTGPVNEELQRATRRLHRHPKIIRWLNVLQYVRVDDREVFAEAGIFETLDAALIAVRQMLKVSPTVLNTEQEYYKH